MKSIIVCALFCVFLPAACKKNSVTLTPAQIIEGSYTAYKHVVGDSITSYPINGKTITMHIDAIGEDSVRLQIRSVQNGIFSPGDTVIDCHLFVKMISTVCWVTLGDQVDSGTAESSIRFEGSSGRFYGFYISSGYYGYYVYVPPGYKLGNVQTLFKKMQ